MKLYRFSPIKSEKELKRAIQHIHVEAHKLCKQAFGTYFTNAGNLGIFCHYDKEYDLLIKLRKKLTQSSNDPNQKYFVLHTPIVISAKGTVPKITYTHLYIRRPDPYRAHVGDIDFYVTPEIYQKLKKDTANGKVKGARVFDRPDLDMIELYNPDSDVLAYVSTKKWAENVRKKLSNITKL